MPDVFMPRLSDTMTEGVISSWLKHEGDMVESGDVIAEIETDKALMDLECYESGKLTRIVAPEGATVPIGETIAVIGEESGAPEQAAPTTPTAASTSAGGSPGGAREVTPAPATPAAAVEPKAERTPAARTPAERPPAERTPTELGQKVRATPLVRKIAREHDIDLTTVTGSGPRGRIVRADVEALLAEGRQSSLPVPAAPAPATGVGGPSPAVSVPAAAATPEDEEIALTPIRRITAERLTQSAAAPNFHLTVAVDAAPLLALRAQLNSQVFGADARCSVTDLLVRGVAVTLAAHREVNSSWGGDRILRRGRINVGVAVAIDKGLVVPVIRDADRKGIAEITAESRALFERARDGRLTPDEFSGGTFTISNLGMFGIEDFTAVINPPEAAILAVGAARQEPVVRDDEVVIRPIMRLTLTSDHRVLDGAVSASFLHDLVETIEQPLRILR